MTVKFTEFRGELFAVRSTNRRPIFRARQCGKTPGLHIPDLPIPVRWVSREDLAAMYPPKETAMENQHREIRGYRDLEQSDIDAINELKAMESQVLAYLKSLGEVHSHTQHVHTGGIEQGGSGFTPAYDPRCLAIARTKLQEAFMWACRAVARPEE